MKLGPGTTLFKYKIAGMRHNAITVVI